MCFCAQNGFTALHLAAQEGKVDVVRLLTEARAQLNIQTKVNVHIMDVSLHIQCRDEICIIIM